jgi:hypothetical protein
MTWAGAGIESASGGNAGGCRVGRYRPLHPTVAQDENALNLLVGVPVPDELLPTELDRRQSAEGNFPRPVLRGAPAPAGCAASRGPAQGGQCRHRRGPRGILPAHFADRRHRHRQQRSLRTLQVGAQGTWSYAPQIVMPILMPARGRRTRPPKCSGKSPSPNTRRRFKAPSGKWPTRWPPAAPWTSRCRRSNPWSMPPPKPTACPSPVMTRALTVT